jgi:para-nitrobenzyl esterase
MFCNYPCDWKRKVSTAGRKHPFIAWPEGDIVGTSENAESNMKTMYAGILVLAAASAPMVAGAQSVVKVVTGSVRGADSAAVDRFLGIPYAQAPLGMLRWHEPLPAKKWVAVRDARRASAACYQAPPAAFGPYTREFLNGPDVSEDCLYLNVWRPHGKRKKLPVYVFIHGGAFNSGSGNIPVYDGAALAQRDIVVVTINYRLGVFGFMAHPELTSESAHKSSGNYGLLDQVAALRWVQTNIAAFGGDPAAVVIGGQSAGAVSVNDLIMTPLAKGLFRGAVAESGSGIGIPASPLATAEQLGVTIQKQLGAASLAQMRTLPAADIFKAASRASAPSGGARFAAVKLPLAPNVDGYVLPADPSDAGQPVASPVPLLTGFNNDEYGLFGAPKNKAEFEEMVRERYGAFAERFLALYPHGTDAEAVAATAQIGRDRAFASLVLWSQQRARSTGQVVHPYFFDHPYPATPSGKAFGAFHTAEVPYVMGVLDAKGRTFTAQDRAVSHAMQDRWTAFIKTGNPALPGQVWAPAGANPVVMGLGDTVAPRQAVSTPERFKAFADFATSGGKLSLF